MTREVGETCSEAEKMAQKNRTSRPGSRCRSCGFAGGDQAMLFTRAARRETFRLAVFLCMMPF